ncbi:type II toxin-antitoxin system VapC family toxin [Microlunatus speluncae]|uniref:type II toxin-antitoxin system VapC family toxin n=1 Tax=Microlunatus speluncae TaxID=2594267 RepID=UPI0013758CC3|nr:type II toxin-antitoxin system VapC family toxin [Microlunatus speluncae]
MLVIDASAFVDLTLGTATEAMVAQVAADGDWHAPEHLTVEVASAFRGLWRGGVLDDAAFSAAVVRLTTARITGCPVRLLLSRIVELAPNLSAYDAAYVALAERLEAPLVTADRRLASLSSARCRFITP